MSQSDSFHPLRNIHFLTWDEADTEGELKPFLQIPCHTSSSAVLRYVQETWRLTPPAIILSVISTSRDIKRWKDQKVREDFQQGVIKAANTTECWIITNGFNRGVSKIIGDAVKEEKLRRAAAHSYQTYAKVGFQKSSAYHVMPKLVVVGLAESSLLIHKDSLMSNTDDGEHFSKLQDTVEIKNDGLSLPDDQQELNPDHTHFIIVDDKTPDFYGMLDFRLRLHRYLSCAVTTSSNLDIRQLIPPSKELYIREESITAGSGSEVGSVAQEGCITTPVVSIVIQGDVNAINIVLVHLKLRLPVIVLKGTGFAADLIAFAFEELQESTDPEYISSYVKPELSRRISKMFPAECASDSIARKRCRDRIIECYNLRKQGKRTYLTVIDVKSASCDLKNLPEYILIALFRAQSPPGLEFSYQMHRDLSLTLDWNCPELAATQIFLRFDGAKVKIEKHVFEQAVLRKHREKFVELFLNQSFQIHQYLTHKKLEMLFERAEDQNFFITVCCGGILGYTFDKTTGDNYRDVMNYMLGILTGNVYQIDCYELSNNAMGVSHLEAAAGERKARNALIMWAVLFNRSELVKVLWRQSEEPLVVALIVSRMYKMFARSYVQSHLVTDMELLADEFEKLAVGTLDVSWNESPHRTYQTLSAQLAEWDNYSIMEIAYLAEAMQFIAHPCCQSWLTSIYLGQIEVKILKFGYIGLPMWFKIWVSAFCLLPMYVWINFNIKKSSLYLKKSTKVARSTESIFSDSDYSKLDETDGSEKEDKDEMDTVSMEDLQNLQEKPLSFSQSLHRTLVMIRKSEVSLPLWKKIFILWDAPVTKFWTVQTFYILYLALFSYAVLLPTCGNWNIDVAVWFWTLTILLEIVRQTYQQYRMYRSLPLFLKYVEIFCIICFLIMFGGLRILGNYFGYYYPFSAKVVMCLGLLYFYYRMIATYLPASPTLGPMLFRIRRMVMVDFLDFMRMFLLFMASGAVVMHAMLYPDYPVNVEMFRTMFYRAWFSLFLTPPASELQGRDDCNKTFASGAEKCSAGIFTDYTCPHIGVLTYALVILYLIICKLILVTLLYAFFSNTNAKIEPISDLIWKYQRYRLVINFSTRLRMPPPLNILSYLISLLTIIINRICCVCCKKKRKITSEQEMLVMRRKMKKQAKKYSYWRMCARSHWLQFRRAQQTQPATELQGTSLSLLSELLESQKYSLRRVKDRLSDIEKALFNTRVCLEDVHHMLGQKGIAGVTGKKGKEMHVEARQSEYPGTRIVRYPVLDKYVPWEKSYSLYDPAVYSESANLFPNHIRKLVDRDIVKIYQMRSQRAVEVQHIIDRDNLDSPTDEEEVTTDSVTPVQRDVAIPWNSYQTVIVDGMKKTIDRTSWIRTDSGSLKYKVDSIGLPINPLGRTGIQGRGVLCYWGPNHRVDMVIARWRTQKKSGGNVEQVFLDGKPLIECLLICKEDGLAFPGGFVHYAESRFSVISRNLYSKVLVQPVPEKLPTTEQEMTALFGKYADSLNELIVQHIYTGYLDDPRNTDNAWIEGETWLFHYKHGKSLDIKIPKTNKTDWKQVKSEMRMPSYQASILQEVSSMLDSVE